MTWPTDVHVDCVQVLLALYVMVYCGVHVDYVQDVTFIVRQLYDMVYCGVYVDCVQDVTNIVRDRLLRCPC